MSYVSANQPATQGHFCVVIVPAALAGAEKNLIEEVQGKVATVAAATGLVYGGRPIHGLLIGNHNAADKIYIKTTTGKQNNKGIPVAADSTLYLPIAGGTADTLLYECAQDFSVAVFY